MFIYIIILSIFVIEYKDNYNDKPTIFFIETKQCIYYTIIIKEKLGILFLNCQKYMLNVKGLSWLELSKNTVYQSFKIHEEFKKFMANYLATTGLYGNPS